MSVSAEQVEATFRKNATLMFALIDNVDEINFISTSSGGEQKHQYQYTRTQIQQSYDKDLRQYAKDLKEFEMLIKSISIKQIVIPKENVNSEEKKRSMSKVWAEALKTRDGEPRYKIMSQKVKEKFIEEQKLRSDPWNFNIGYSSPLVINYDLTIKGDRTTIIYHLTDSTGEKYDKTEVLLFGKENNQTVVVDVEEKLESWEKADFVPMH